MGTAFLLLRLEAPLMAFGAPMVDFIGPTRRFPGQAQIAGLLGNALGYHHRDAEALETLQARLRMAAAVLRPRRPSDPAGRPPPGERGAGERLRDYQTVFLGRPHLVDTGWTTRGTVEKRAGASSQETHIRHRWHVADSLVLVALTLEPADQAPQLADLAEALHHPARPLFIGRKSCLPTAPIGLGRPVEADSAADALRKGVALLISDKHRVPLDANLTAYAELDERLRDEADAHETERLIDGRDWRNQIHTRTRGVRRRSLALGRNP